MRFVGEEAGNTPSGEEAETAARVFGVDEAAAARVFGNEEDVEPRVVGEEGGAAARHLWVKEGSVSWIRASAAREAAVAAQARCWSRVLTRGLEKASISLSPQRVNGYIG